MNGLDLFSGIGGISIALEPWVRTIAYCEQDRFAQSVLLSRMSEGKLHKAPIWDDVQTLTGEMLPAVDIIFGGFPCQDLSVAGLGKGLAGKRSGLFFEIIRLTKETRAPFVFLENVPAIRTRGLREVIRTFTEIGYDCRWTCISAASVGAPHKRERWFLLAHANSAKLREQQGRRSGESRKESIQSAVYVENGTNPDANSISKRLRQPSEWDEDPKSLWTMASDDWDYNAELFLRVDNGLRHRAHQVKCLGNSVVPQQVRKAFETLSGVEIFKG